MSEFADADSIVLEEKPLEGEGNYVLRLIQIHGEKNNLRICLSAKGLKSNTVFGGNVAFEIRPDENRHYFEQIKTEEQFVRLSERIRKIIVDTLKG